MADEPGHGPVINIDAEPTPEEKAIMQASLRNGMRPPRPPPTEALNLVFETACRDTGGSQAARNFLFWLAGRPDPSGFQGNGGLEIRRLDARHKAAALDVLAWWVGGTESDEPLYGILKKLELQLSIEGK